MDRTLFELLLYSIDCFEGVKIYLSYFLTIKSTNQYHKQYNMLIHKKTQIYNQKRPVTYITMQQAFHYIQTQQTKIAF